jgi:hypothetical protein
VSSFQTQLEANKIVSHPNMGAVAIAGENGAVSIVDLSSGKI